MAAPGLHAGVTFVHIPTGSVAARGGRGDVANAAGLLASTTIPVSPKPRSTIGPSRPKQAACVCVARTESGRDLGSRPRASAFRTGRCLRCSTAPKDRFLLEDDLDGLAVDHVRTGGPCHLDRNMELQMLG